MYHNFLACVFVSNYFEYSIYDPILWQQIFNRLWILTSRQPGQLFPDLLRFDKSA